jgi:predicted PolB exonuclease-like 3'-5' exonuclease
MGLPGKPDGMTGAEVEKYYRDGHIREIGEYCESDVLNTYRVCLRYETPPVHDAQRGLRRASS